VSRSCWFQTNGGAAPLDSGDWYTNAGTASVDRVHRFHITIPPEAAFPVTIRVLDAESRVAATDHDEVRGERDPTRFRLTRLDGTSSAQIFSSNSPNGSAFTTVVTAGHGPGTYLLTSETGALPIFDDATVERNNDENAFLIEVTPDGLDTSGREDDVDVAFTQATLACTDSRSSLSLRYHVPAGTTTTTVRNFDLDSPGRATGPLEYFAPDGSSIAGTLSPDEVWNGAGGTMNEGGDVVPIEPAREGPWTIVVFGLDAANQVAFEVQADGNRLPLSMTFRPNNVAPTANLEAPGTVDEGSPFELALTDVADPDGDPSDLRFFFDCGDAVFTGPFAEALSGCVAGNDGLTTVRGKVADGDGGETTYSTTMTVENVPPAFTPPALQTVPLRPRASVRVGRFADPGPDAPWSAEIDWGDGTPRTTRTIAAAGPLPVLKHQFRRTGLHQVTVTLTDDHESSTASFALRVRRLCVVPSLKGKRIAAARTVLRRLDCRVGRVTRVFSAKARAGRVIAQRPGKGKIRPRGTRMQLVVSKGRRSG